jgi:hypothetical protein
MPAFSKYQTLLVATKPTKYDDETLSRIRDVGELYLRIHFLPSLFCTSKSVRFMGKNRSQVAQAAAPASSDKNGYTLQGAAICSIPGAEGMFCE